MRPKRRKPVDIPRVKAASVGARRKRSASPGIPGKALHKLKVRPAEPEAPAEESRDAEAMLQRYWERYQSLYDDAPVGYVTLGRDNVVSQVNRAAVKLLGRPRSSLVGRRFADLLAPRSRALFNEVASEVLSTAASRTFDGELRATSGTPCWAQLDLAALPFDGELRIALVDVTAQRAAERKLRDLAQELITLQEKERAAVASVLHDDAGQQLTYLGLLLDQAREAAAPGDTEQIDEMRSLTRKILEGIRRLSATLSPAEIGRVGLPAAVRGLVGEYSARSRTQVSFHPRGAFDWVSPKVALSAYRIVQEALTNCARHARPTSVRVVLRAAGRTLRVQVQDDGKGFDPRTQSLSIGILTMQERARAAGGRLDVRSAPGKGTRVTFDFPPRYRTRPRSPADGNRPLR